MPEISLSCGDNSSAVLTRRQPSRDLLVSTAETASSNALRMALRGELVLESDVTQVVYTRRLPAGARPTYGRIRPLEREGTVVTVPIGYADGVTRRLAKIGGEVLIGGRRYPYAGIVTMDQIVIDVGDAAVSPGDEVVLLGVQGDEEIDADEWAGRLDSVSWEILCGFGPRLPRRYRS